MTVGEKKKKARNELVSARGDETRSHHIRIPSLAASRNGEVVVGALAFSQEDSYEARSFTDRDLVHALRLANVKANLVLCSGARFWTDRFAKKTKTIPYRTIAREIYAAAGCPVLLEWYDEEASPWKMATRQGMVPVRRDQYVMEADDINACAPKVIAELAQGWGVFPVTGGHIDRLLLLICNEAKVLDGFKRKRFSEKGLDAVFGGRWALLHPAHRPYDLPPNRTGRDLVATGKRAVPRLARVTAAGASLSFGTGLSGPCTVVHAGPFRQYRRSFDRDVAVIGFHKGRVLTARGGVVEPPGLATFRYAEFKL